MRKEVQTFLKWATDPKLAVLDTETTGLYGEVIEVAIVDAQGRTLFNERMRPNCPIESGATEAHGITDADVAGLLTIAAYWPLLLDIMSRYNVVIYNAAFDLARLQQSADEHIPYWDLAEDLGSTEEFIQWQAIRRKTECVMLAYAPLHGRWNAYYQNWRWARLRRACYEQGVDNSDLKAHTALDDCLFTLRLIQAVAVNSGVKQWGNAAQTKRLRALRVAADQRAQGRQIAHNLARYITWDWARPTLEDIGVLGFNSFATSLPPLSSGGKGQIADIVAAHIFGSPGLAKEGPQ